MIGTKQSKRAWLQMILFIRGKISFSTHSLCGDPSLSRHIYLILSPASPPPYPSPPNLLWLHSLRTWESRYHGDGWTMAPSILKKKSSTQTYRHTDTHSHTLAILVNDPLSLGRVFMWRIFLLFFSFSFFLPRCNNSTPDMSFGGCHSRGANPNKGSMRQNPFWI